MSAFLKRLEQTQATDQAEEYEARLEYVYTIETTAGPIELRSPKRLSEKQMATRGMKLRASHPRNGTKWLPEHRK